MIIDLILDRKENEELMKDGLTHIHEIGKGMVSLAYNPSDFYRDVFDYQTEENCHAADITYAMDYGTETDVKAALFNYVIDNDYSPEVLKYINSVNWL